MPCSRLVVERKVPPTPGPMLRRSTPAKSVSSQVCSPQATPSWLARARSRRAPESSWHGAVDRTSTTVVAARAGEAAGRPGEHPDVAVGQGHGQLGRELAGWPWPPCGCRPGPSEAPGGWGRGRWRSPPRRRCPGRWAARSPGTGWPRAPRPAPGRRPGVRNASAVTRHTCLPATKWGQPMVTVCPVSSRESTALASTWVGRHPVAARHLGDAGPPPRGRRRSRPAAGFGSRSAAARRRPGRRRPRPAPPPRPGPRAAPPARSGRRRASAHSWARTTGVGGSRGPAPAGRRCRSGGSGGSRTAGRPSAWSRTASGRGRRPGSATRGQHGDRAPAGPAATAAGGRRAGARLARPAMTKGTHWAADRRPAGGQRHDAGRQPHPERRRQEDGGEGAVPVPAGEEHHAEEGQGQARPSRGRRTAGAGPGG